VPAAAFLRQCFRFFRRIREHCGEACYRKGGRPSWYHLKCVEKAIAAKRDWKVRRYITIGLFTFPTLAMYNDLGPPSEKPLEEAFGPLGALLKRLIVIASKVW
jgi:hypothetical protein